MQRQSCLEGRNCIIRTHTARTARLRSSGDNLGARGRFLVLILRITSSASCRCILNSCAAEKLSREAASTILLLSFEISFSRLFLDIIAKGFFLAFLLDVARDFLAGRASWSKLDAPLPRPEGHKNPMPSPGPVATRWLNPLLYRAMKTFPCSPRGECTIGARKLLGFKNLWPSALYSSASLWRPWVWVEYPIKHCNCLF